MILTLSQDVMVRVPEDKAGGKIVFYTAKKGTPVNYSSKVNDTSHKVHKFDVLSREYGYLTYTCVTPLNEPPPWI